MNRHPQTLLAGVDGSCSLAPEFLQQLRAGGGDNPALIAEQILTKLQKAAGDAANSSVALRREPTKVATLLELCWNTDDKHVQRAVLLVAAQLLSDSVLFTVLTMGNNLQAKIIARLQRDGDGDATSSLTALQALYSATRRQDDQIFLAEAALPRVLHLLGTCQMAVLFDHPIPPQRLEHLLSDIVRLLVLSLARVSDRTHLVVVRTLLLLAKWYSALVLERHKCDRLFVRMLRHPSVQLRYTVLCGLLAAARTPPASFVVRDQLQYPLFGNVRLLSPAIKAAILAHPDSFYVKWARYSGEVKRIMSGEPAATQAKLLAAHLLEFPFLLPSDSTSTDEERRQAVKWLTGAVEQLNKQPPALLLDIHLCLLTGDAARTRKLCDSVIVPMQSPRTSRSVQDQRHPLIYLVRCLIDDNHSSRLRLAKRGLSMQTPKAEGFVRLGLLEVSVLSLMELAMQGYSALSDLTLVYLRTASEDAEQYLSCAPLDAPALSRMAICRFLCRAVLEAPRSLDIADVHRVQKALSSVDPMHRALYHTSHHWCPRDVYNLVAKWAPALWPEAMDSLDNESSAPLDDETCRRLRGDCDKDYKFSARLTSAQWQQFHEENTECDDRPGVLTLVELGVELIFQEVDGAVMGSKESLLHATATNLVKIDICAKVMDTNLALMVKVQSTREKRLHSNLMLKLWRRRADSAQPLESEWFDFSEAAQPNDQFTIPAADILGEQTPLELLDANMVFDLAVLRNCIMESPEWPWDP
ncbi:hypothetical protein RI367_006532 [Sorochytrium milnesiophthora]